MNNFLNWIPVLFLCSAPVFVFGQYRCSTEPSGKYPIMTYQKVNEVLSRRSFASSFTVNLMVYIIRDDNGNFGPTHQETIDELEIMQSHYAPANMCFALIGIGEIWESDYINNWVSDWETLGPQLVNQFGSTDRIDMFIVPSEVGSWGGNAFDIPNHFFAMNEANYGAFTMSHEMGHCLNLYHTHHYYDKFNDGDITDICDQLLERVNGINSETAGDLCSDTPADPEQISNEYGCSIVSPYDDCNNQLFNPPFENIMGYGQSCRESFTTDQIDRIHSELTSGPVGMNIVAPSDVDLTNTVVSSGFVFITAGNYINHNSGVVYQISGSVLTKHIASNHITLRPGFWSDPSENGRYEAYLSPLCN